MPAFEFDPTRYPASPGCYLMRDGREQVIYVGKAKNLQRRLASYFRARPKRGRLKRLVASIADVEVILVNTEVEALVLENNLIKRHKPRFNRVLTDDDTGYYYIALTGEDLPRFIPYRKNHVNKELSRADGTDLARRFGPYVSRRFRDGLLDFVTENFQIRTCAPLPEKVCLRHHLGWCGGICEGKITADAYRQTVDDAKTFLERQHLDLIEQMKARMLAFADQLEFEKAQRIKTQVEALSNTLQPQFVERDVDYDQDVIYFGDRHALVMNVQRGAIQCLRLVDLEPDEATPDRNDRFLLAAYAANSPAELIVNRLADPRNVERTLSEANGYLVRILIPEAEEPSALLQLCELNYAHRVGNRISAV